MNDKSHHEVPTSRPNPGESYQSTTKSSGLLVLTKDTSTDDRAGDIKHQAPERTSPSASTIIPLTPMQTTAKSCQVGAGRDFSKRMVIFRSSNSPSVKVDQIASEPCKHNRSRLLQTESLKDFDFSMKINASMFEKPFRDFADLKINFMKDTAQKNTQSSQESNPLGSGTANKSKNLTTVFSEIPKEEYPSSRFFSDNFQNGLSLGCQLAGDCAELLEQIAIRQGPVARESGHIDSQIQKMKKATELHNFFSTQKVAFLGDSMSGKSSLINSLLDFPRLAAADDFGSAVTSIVTEYRQKRPSQTQRIQVEVEYFHGVTMEAHIMELLWSSRRVFLPNVAQNSLSAADWNEIKEKSKQAWSALQSAFGSQVGFSKRFLSDQSEGAFERITEQLIRWSKTIPWPTSADDGRWVAFAETAEELLDKTSVFTKTQVWPFTKIMRIYVDAPILKAGFVIADLPGLLDKNLARVQATQDYISTCDRVFHVVDIRRALTSQSLESALNMTAPSPSANEEEPTNRWSQSAVICTMSDEIDEIGAERHLQSSGSVKTLMTMETLDEEIRKANLEEDSSQLRKLQSKKRTLLIQARNERVENGLKTTYNSSKSDDLQVFCVSNVFYSKCRFQKSDPTVLNQLEDALSNIPALRKFCYSTLANSRLHEAKNFILSALPSYIASICLHFQPLESGPTCSLDEILKEVDLNKESILNTIHYSRKKVNELFEMRINGHFNRYRETWQKEAIQKGEEWLSMPAVEYQAFCRKNGKHVDIWDEPVDWNSELIGIIQPALGSVWNDLEKDVSSYTSVLHRDLDKIFAVLKYSLSLKNFPSFLIESISWREQEIRQAIEKSWGELRREMQSIRAKALGSNENSFILRAMLPAYRAAASFDGNFKGKELHEKVQGRIKDSMLFQDMVSAASSEMHLASQRLEERLKTDIAKDRFSAIVGDVCSVYSTITLAKTDDEEEKQTSEETMSLESLKFKCRGLKARHNYIAKFMYLY